MFSWKRFWVPLNANISCGYLGDGFLDDPESEWSPNHAIARTLDTLIESPCLVLSGEPGLGKTVSLEQAFPTIDHASGGGASIIWVRFRDVPDGQTFTRRVFESDRWKEWLQNDRTLTIVLDGLDEGLIKIKDFVSFLTSELKLAPVDRLKLVTACRTADWPVAAGNKLLGLWNTDLRESFWELCPLRRVDAELAAAGFGVESKKFLEAVFEKNVATLAARPTTLFFLLRQFASNQQLEGTHREIYERGIVDLCREPDAQRAESTRIQNKAEEPIAAEQLRDAAAYVAALLILSGRSAVCTAHNNENAAQIDLLLDTVLVNATALGLSRRAITAALNTALFSSRGENRLGFAHQTFAECLAARQVSKMPLPQLRKLFCGSDSNEENVIPQVAETAAWLAASSDDFLKHVLRIDPEVLLRSDIARIQATTKKKVVAAILEKAARLELFDDRGFGRFLYALKHDDLADQLWTYIQDHNLNVIVRRLALDIAEACNLAELNDRLLTVVSDATFDQQIRQAAARVLHKTLPDDGVSELEPFARGQIGADPDGEMKAYALRRLVPNRWSVEAALPYLTSPKNSHYHGHYYMFLHYDVPKAIVVGDVCAVLNWLENVDLCFDILNPFSRIASRTLVIALTNLNRPEIRNAAVRFWGQKKSKFERFESGDRDDQLEDLWKDDALRRDFAFSVVQDSGTTENDVAHLLFDTFSLFEGRDLGWILEQLPNIAPDRRVVWAKVIWHLARPENTVHCWDLFLETIRTLPELQNRFAWLREWKLDEPEARHAKAEYLRDERRRRRFARRRTTPDWNEVIEADLRLIGSGKTWNWINLCDHLFLKEGETRYSLHHDVTVTPGWERASEERRAAIRQTAKQFLLEQNDGYEALNKRTNYSDPGYLAIWLLRDEIKRSEELQKAIRKKWIRGIVGYFNNAEEHYQVMVALAYWLNADATVDALGQENEHSYRQQGYAFGWRGFGRTWNPRLSSILGEFALSHRTKRETLISSLCPLFELDRPAFLSWMQRILPRARRFNREARAVVVGIAHALMPAETWSLVWPLLSADRGFAAEVLLIVASQLELEVRRRSMDLNPNQLRELAALLYQVFPPDSNVERLNGVVTPRQAIADYRRKICDALTASTDARAGTALLWLSQVFPEYKIEFMYRYRDHLKTRRRTFWNPPMPAEVSAMLTDSHKRLVSNERDLFEVVTESLQRFEEYYTRNELPAVERLWQRADTDKKAKSKAGRQTKSFKPKDEETFSDEIARWLRDDLKNKGVVIGREVQIERAQKTDVLVKAIAPSSVESAEELVVVAEVKGCWNPHVLDDIDDQLVKKYLLPHNWTFGLYLVGWFVCDAWKNPRNFLKSQQIEDGRREVQQLGETASANHPGVTVLGMVIDCRHR